jgi:hypothetical protein
MKEEDNIGKFFKGRLEDNEFEFDENQWSDLEKRLDASDPGTTVNDRPGNYKIAPWAIVTGIALIAFWSGWYLKPSDVSRQDALSENTEHTNREENTGTSHSSEKLALLNRSHANQQDSQFLMPTKGEYNDQQRKSIAGNQNNKMISQTIDENDSKTGLPGSGSINKKSFSTSLIDTRELINNIKLPILTNTDSSTRHLDSTVKSISDPQKFNRKWSVSAFLAPEFNGTSFSTSYKSTSQAGGLSVEFYPTAKLKIGAGLVVNNKIYTAGKGDYVPEKGFWTNGIAPDATEARCLILDIPLTIGYRIAGNDKRSIWVNAGLSSYWMLTENYHYVYEPTDPALVQGWNGKRENFDAFSSLNLSIAYERRIKERLFLLVEPYYKLPVGGIGHGSVNLISSGVNLGFRYTLNKHKVKPLEESSHDP